MKAALWYARHDVRVEDIPEPVPARGMVKVRVKWCGICGSDLHEFLGGPIFIPVDKPHPLSGEKAPVVLGHEFSGEVVEVGEDVTSLKAGDRVVVEPMRVCRPDDPDMCPACREGKYNLCTRLGFHGLCGGGGGFAEYTTFYEEFVHKIPDTLPFDKAALVEPLAVALQSLKQGDFSIGQTALVLGAGPIGLATIESLKAAGARLVIVMQRKSIRQEYALRSGADVVLDPNEVDVPSEVKKLTDGYGVDVSFETTGSQSGFDKAIESVKPGGTAVITSIWEGAISFNPNAVVFQEKKVVGTIAYRHLFPAAITMLADGRIKGDGWITKKVALENIVEEGFGTLTGPEKKKQVKVLVTPDSSLL
ncbi:MAG: 2,3-butanediol dehydrogenase [Aminobacterium sp.]|jgi:(R,R)-butanediol dehydrogenase/meso-butanediol dehydrogenase/diacetyl reductase|uniref:2,3-butanediol dehydrogenase n=1 Tax=Aminobacterium sp. MB27-C1 TaxID=3070661 RepID=UPI001BCADEDB|nr:2,3-butanediol dehydrogenase [Aminobacterium sp. MB27-C1]MDD2206288.1 2,3-butanediol dehydrogenase [Aminobacterium sp.]MDD3708161.1 2,3-butanediol dehydrogenase [Aminobacterium sp.]MDD4228305.1 2,3-butanediol dehydrogenase [Aminobacterium sp.]MDD4551776.1 2,3-butanediol dehydrogenase [Aminobacterium sp.]WMI71349.1 2,3-butanediol dehydrogenase [Aminobacterium sp. MB27-C1]